MIEKKKKDPYSNEIVAVPREITFSYNTNTYKKESCWSKSGRGDCEGGERNQGVDGVWNMGSGESPKKCLYLSKYFGALICFTYKVIFLSLHDFR